MKIEIEWNGSTEATMKIDGREIKVQLKPGVTSMVGVKGDAEDTVGGMAASALFPIVADIMQGEAIAQDDLCENYSTWGKLPEHLADAVFNRIS